jgi:hypothetical protein
MARHGLGLEAPRLGWGRVLFEGTYMEKPTEEQIKRRAYELWERAGKPEGREEEFYYQAEEELRKKNKPSPEPDIL